MGISSRQALDTSPRSWSSCTTAVSPAVIVEWDLLAARRLRELVGLALRFCLTGLFCWSLNFIVSCGNKDLARCRSSSFALCRSYVLAFLEHTGFFSFYSHEHIKPGESVSADWAASRDSCSRRDRASCGHMHEVKSLSQTHPTLVRVRSTLTI